MPLFKTINLHPNVKVYIWKITETLEDLSKIHLNSNSLQRVQQMKSESHQKGFLSIRHLLKHLHLSDNDLFYNSFGKPLLKNKQHISITHSFDFAALVISDQPIGIDIEQQRDKILKIRHRFCDILQNQLSLSEYILILTYIWGAKEAMFKIHPTGGIDFKNELIISPFNNKNNHTYGKINTTSFQKDLNLYFYEIENYCLSIATPYQCHTTF